MRSAQERRDMARRLDAKLVAIVSIEFGHAGLLNYRGVVESSVTGPVAIFFCAGAGLGGKRVEAGAILVGWDDVILSDVAGFFAAAGIVEFSGFTMIVCQFEGSLRTFG